jgi:hypothetical protein
MSSGSWALLVLVLVTRLQHVCILCGKARGSDDGRDRVNDLLFRQMVKDSLRRSWWSTTRTSEAIFWLVLLGIGVSVAALKYGGSLPDGYEDGCEEGGSEYSSECRGYSAVFRVSFALTAFFPGLGCG